MGQAPAHSQYASETLLRYGYGRKDCLRDRDAGKEARPHPLFRQNDHIKGTSGTPEPLTGAGSARSAVKQPHHPVPQGQRGILWEWSGQLRQLPPPSVGIAPPVCRQRACILPVPGVSSRAVLPPENTAHFEDKFGIGHRQIPLHFELGTRELSMALPFQLFGKIGYASNEKGNFGQY